MAFSAERYLIHVESPEITPNENKRTQVIDCVMKYFDMHPNSLLSKERLSCKTYIKSILSEDVLYAYSVEDLAVKSIIEAAEGYLRSEGFDANNQAFNDELFAIYCSGVSKYIEFGGITYEEGIAKITKWHEKCNISGDKEELDSHELEATTGGNAGLIDWLPDALENKITTVEKPNLQQ